MNVEQRNLALQNAVLEWQKKYGIRDGDPILASLELFHVYLRTYEPATSGARSPTFEEFRESIELLDGHAKSFAKQAGELAQELRRFPATARSGHAFFTFALVCAAFGGGIAVAKFLL